MDIATSKNKIVEVLAYAREVLIRHDINFNNLQAT